MKNLHLFFVISATLRLLAHGAPITDGGVVCNNTECVKEAEAILKDMKPHLNPCDDFEEFACGGFFYRATNSSDGTWEYSYPVMFTKMDKKTNEILYGLVNAKDPATPKPDPKDQASMRNVQRMHDNFAACMDEAQLSKAGREPLRRQLEKVVKAYPVPDSPIQPKKAPGVTIMKYGMTGQFLRNGWTPSINLPMEHTKATGNKGDLSLITGQFLGNGLPTHIRLSVTRDIWNASRNLMYVEPGSILSSQAYKNSSLVQSYEQLIGEMFYIIYEPIDPTIGRNGTAPLVVPPVWKVVAKDVVEFETQLAEVIAQAEDQYKALPTVKLAELTPSWDWNVILREALPSDVAAPSEVAVRVAGSGLYLERLSTLLDATEPRKIQLYFAWSMIYASAEYLDASRRRPLYDFYQKAGEKQSDRITICSGNTLRNVPDVVSHYYVEAALPKRDFDMVKGIIDAIISTYSNSLQTKQPYDWLTDPTRKGALAKFTKLATKIGNSYSGPDNRNSSSINQFYNGLQLDGQDHFGNQVRAKIFRTQIKFRKLYEGVDRMHMEDNTLINNAYYNPGVNGIDIPAGRTQSPMFNVDFPEYLNYGTFGMTVAHELTHALDNMGIKYDEMGNSNDQWFDPPSLEAFNNRAECLVGQYSNFSIPGPNGNGHLLRGDLQLRENIADNGGIKKAYEAWHGRYKLDPQGTKYNNKLLPNLNYTPEQMFFIQFARSWCTKNDPANWEYDQTATHSPPKYRIIGTLQNSQDFAKAFNCQPGSYMNPLRTKNNDTKCEVW